MKEFLMSALNWIIRILGACGGIFLLVAVGEWIGLIQNRHEEFVKYHEFKFSLIILFIVICIFVFVAKGGLV